MMPRPPRSLVVLLALAVPLLCAFSLTSKRWSPATATFYTGISGTAPSGVRYSTAFEQAMQQWNDRTSFKFVADRSYLDPCTNYTRSTTGDFPRGDGDRRNAIDFRSTVCGNDFGSSVLAIALTFGTSGRFGFDNMREADIIFNDRYNWDVYDGPRQPGKTDFRRVALHELGHALGLGHENIALAIMAPRITDMYELQDDDIAGVNALYRSASQCRTASLMVNSLVRDSLNTPDCKVQELFAGGSDDSFVDVYKLVLNTTTRVVMDMRSSELDSVLVLTDTKLNELDIADDYLGTCNARLDKTLLAGEYLLLANTYAQPRKCVGNKGAYTLSITDGTQPVLGESATSNGSALASALFTGGASADGGKTYKSSFTASERIDVDARIAVDPAHVGQSGKVYALIQLSNGTRFGRAASGEYIPVGDDLSQLAAYRSGLLEVNELLTVAKGLQGEAMGLAGLNFVVYVGYALDSRPYDIHYGADPIRFSIIR